MKNSKKVLTTMLVLMIVAFMVGCANGNSSDYSHDASIIGSDTVTQTEDELSFRAKILELYNGSALVQTIDIDGMGLYLVTRLTFGTRELEDISAFVGDIVNVVFTGEITLSYPGQVFATSWAIVERYEPANNANSDVIAQEPPQYPLEVKIIFENISAEERATLTNIHEMDFRAAYIRAAGENTSHDISVWEESLAWLDGRGGLLLTTNTPLRNVEIFGISHVWDDATQESAFYATQIYYQLGELLPARPLFMDMFFTTGGVFPSRGIAFTDPNGARPSFALVENRIDNDPPFFLQEFQDGEINP